MASEGTDLKFEEAFCLFLLGQVYFLSLCFLNLILLAYFRIYMLSCTGVLFIILLFSPSIPLSLASLHYITVGTLH